MPTRLHVLIRIALRNLMRYRRRSLIGIVSVAFGIGALLVATGFTEWMFVDFREATIESQYGHIQVSRPGFQEDGRSDLFRYMLPKDVGVAGLDRTPHVRAIVPRLLLAGLVSRGDATVSFVGEGVDPSLDLKGERALRIVDGRRLAPGNEGDVLLGEGLARLLGAVPGERVVLLANTPRGGLNALELTVAGTFASFSKAYDDSALLIPLSSAHALLKVQGAHTWRIYLDDTAQTDRVAADLRRRLDPRSFEVRTWDQLAEFYVRAVPLLRDQIDVLRLIVVAIILLGIGNTMTMTVMERTSEIGTSMALGVRRRAVLAQFLAEGALLGLVGGLVGLVLSGLAAASLGAAHIEMPPPPGLARGYVARVLLTGPMVLQSLAVAVATTSLASLYPAWRASRMVIVDAIRRQR